MQYINVHPIEWHKDVVAKAFITEKFFILPKVVSYQEWKNIFVVIK